jgi:hypothetical protein
MVALTQQKLYLVVLTQRLVERMFESCRGHQILRNATKIVFGRANSRKNCIY